MHAPKPAAEAPADSLRAHQALLFALASLAELRESASANHLLRVQHYVRLLAEPLRQDPLHAEALSPVAIDTLCGVLCVYDLGTLALPDRILLKPGPLDPDEWAAMRAHTTLGHAALCRVAESLGAPSPVLELAKDIALSHHERWDGSGYPDGLAGTQIPLAARLLALADVFDALISNKIYREGVAPEAAVRIVFGERGRHFDPDVVDAFMQRTVEFAEVAARFPDTPQDLQKSIDYMARAIAEETEL